MVHMISGVVALINEDNKTLGTKTEGIYIWLAMQSAVLYGLMANADWAMNLAIPAIAAGVKGII